MLYDTLAPDILRQARYMLIIAIASLDCAVLCHFQPASSEKPSWTPGFARTSIVLGVVVTRSFPIRE